MAKHTQALCVAPYTKKVCLPMLYINYSKSQPPIHFIKDSWSINYWYRRHTMRT